jgi:hypothetical protein
MDIVATYKCSPKGSSDIRATIIWQWQQCYGVKNTFKCQWTQKSSLHLSLKIFLAEALFSNTLNDALCNWTHSKRSNITIVYLLHCRLTVSKMHAKTCLPTVGTSPSAPKYCSVSAVILWLSNSEAMRHDGFRPTSLERCGRKWSWPVLKEMH